MQQFALLILTLLVAQTFAIENVCNSFTNNMTTDGFSGHTATFHFGIGDNATNPTETSYAVPLYWGWYTMSSPVDNFNTDFYFQVDDSMDTNLDSIGPLFVNYVPLMGGRNWSLLNSDYVRTANFECADDNQSFMWGPAYSDFRRGNKNLRSVTPYLETYVHVSAPNTSTYMRYIAFITNKSDKQEKLNVHTATYLNYPYMDISPFNEARYVAGYPWLDNDPGQISTFRDSYSAVLTSVHARGYKGRDTRFASYVDHDCWDTGLTYNGFINAGETKAVMIVYSFAKNTSQMLQRAIRIDTEPSELFHGLNADQLSQIANWGACQAVLGPDVSVTVTPPSSCSSGITSDFTVQATTTRNDLTKPFTHRVVVTQGTNEFSIVAAQSSTTLSVINNIGQVKHQLWYNGCLVKETPFTACSNKATPTAKRSVVAAEVTQKKSESSLIRVSTSLLALSALLLRTSTTVRLSIFVLVLLASNTFAYPNVCNSFTANNMPVGSIAEFNFGINDSPNNDTLYFVPLQFGTNLCCDLPNGETNNTNMWLNVEADMTALMGSFGPLFVNYVPLMGGFNYTTYSAEYVQTANFECSNEGQTIMWGPAYPDIRRNDGDIRGQFQHLEAYIQVSAPNATNYMRYIAFITNKSNKQEKLHVQTVNYGNDYPLDIAPFNDGRYIASFPFGDNDPGTNPGDADSYSAYLTATNVRGPKARDTNVLSYNDLDCWDVGLTYNGKIEAGETKAFMIVYSFAPNKTRMLQRAAWVDTEPAELFHGLNADQLSQIINWGACEVMLGPDVSVTVTPPSSCSSGLTSDFTVQATTTRDDFTKSFTHRVVGGVIPVEIVPAQSSTTLSVVNDAGPVVHQLWYNGCLVKETPFTACETAVPPTAPVAATVPVATTPTGKTSDTATDAPIVTLATSTLLIGTLAAMF